GSLFNQKRVDRLYMSEFSHFDGSAQLIATREYTGSIMSTDNEEFSFNYEIPYASSGTKYFYVATNENKLFEESNHSNNVSASAGVAISLTTPVDLVVQTITMPATVSSLRSGNAIYTVVDQAGNGFSGTWTDQIYV